jgi:hypothetical protein
MPTTSTVVTDSRGVPQPSCDQRIHKQHLCRLGAAIHKSLKWYICPACIMPFCLACMGHQRTRVWEVYVTRCVTAYKVINIIVGMGVLWVASGT